MSGVQSLAVSLAVLGGGIWSLFTFRTLSTRRKALAEVADLEARAKRQGVVNTSLSVTQFAWTPLRDLAVSIDVTLTNVGSRNALVRFADDAITVTECVPSGSSIAPLTTRYVPYDFLASAESPPGANDLVIRAGKTWHLPFIARLPRPGLYNILIQLRLSSPEAAIAAESGLLASPDTIVWSDSAFVVVHRIAEDGTIQSPPPLADSRVQNLLASIENVAVNLAQLYESDRVAGEDDGQMLAAIELLAAARIELLYSKISHDSPRLTMLREWCMAPPSHFTDKMLAAMGFHGLRSEVQKLHIDAA